MDGQVKALVVYNGALVAGGSFFTASGLEVGYIAKWTGNESIDLEGGTNSIVSALAVYNGNLIAAGYFTEAGGPANHIAQWDGEHWTPLGDGLNSQVMALTVYGNELIAAGFFTTAGGQPANHIASWNGTAWSPLGSGISWITYALAVHDGQLAAGGLFTHAGGNPATRIESWDGSAWSALGAFYGGESTSAVYALMPWGTDVVAGGIFYGNVSVWTEPTGVPEPVLDLSISVSAGLPRLQWTPTGAAWYDVYGADQPWGPFDTWLGSAEAGEFIDLAGVPTNGQRFYRVVAVER